MFTAINVVGGRYTSKLCHVPIKSNTLLRVVTSQHAALHATGETWHIANHSIIAKVSSRKASVHLNATYVVMKRKGPYYFGTPPTDMVTLHLGAPACTPSTSHTSIRVSHATTNHVSSRKLNIFEPGSRELAVGF